MEYEKCLVELDEILKHLKEDELRKIPYEIRKAIKEKKDKGYKWDYDESKDLDEQNINRKTIAILSYLNMEYLLNEEQRLLMEKIHKCNEEKIEKQKRKEYNSNSIFKKNILNVDEKVNEDNYENKIKLNDNYGDMQMIIIKKDKWYKKMIKVIVNIFCKNK